MYPTTPEEKRGLTVMNVVWTSARAARSTCVIGALAVGLFILRREDVTWREMGDVALANRRLLAVVFFAMMIWDVWSRRARRLVAEGRPRVDPERERPAGPAME